MGRPRVQPEKLPFLMNLWELIMLTLFNWEKNLEKLVLSCNLGQWMHSYSFSSLLKQVCKRYDIHGKCIQ